MSVGSTLDRSELTTISNLSMHAQINTLSNINQNNALLEPKSEFYEDRINILFNRELIYNDNYFFRILKKSQDNVKKKYDDCTKTSFFKKKQSHEYTLAISLKENFANYCLIFSIYFQEKEIFKAMRLFLLMCEQNKNYLEYLTEKIENQLPRISNTNKIAHFYPTITKTMLQILGICIKLSGKFLKTEKEVFFIKLYFRIVHILSKTVIKTFPGNTEEFNNQLKNERRYLYTSCLFDAAIYLYKRFRPLFIPIRIFQHIMDYYKNELTFFPNEIETILLLKVNYNLGLFYYINGSHKEAIINLNQAKEGLFDITSFPVLNKKLKFDEKSSALFSSTNNSSSTLFNFNDLFKDYNNMKNVRNNWVRSSLSSCTFILNDNNSIGKGTFISKLKEKELKRDEQTKIDMKKKKFSTIYLGAYSLLHSENPILIGQIKEKLLIEIELLLSEIELKNKNYRESLNHINAILAMQLANDVDEYIKDVKNNPHLNLRESAILNKNKSLYYANNNHNNNNNCPNNYINSNHNNNKDEKQYLVPFKQNMLIDSDLSLISNGKKSEIRSNNNTFRFINNNTCINSYKKKKSNNLKYNLSISDQHRISILLEHIERANTINNNLSSTKKMRTKFNINNPKKRNESLKKERKIKTSEEMEKFFVFICSLSVYQLKVLNDSQPEPSPSRNDLPIVFNNQFQDCLTNAQRMSLSSLETMSLSRYIVLKDTNKDIDPENFDYRFMKYRIKETDSDDEISNKMKKINGGYKFEFCQRKCSNDSTITLNSQFNDYVLQNNNNNNNDSNSLDLLLNKIKTKKNKIFIDLHKNSILKLFNQMSEEEVNELKKSPKLLKSLINSALKHYAIKENGGNINNISYIRKKKYFKDNI